MPDSPRWCARCEQYGDHHTDRCPKFAQAASVATYRSPHGIEQDRRDFMRDNPELYVYIARREAHKALDAVGDLISGHHEAANLVWHRAGVMRKGYEDMQQARASTEAR